MGKKIIVGSLMIAVLLTSFTSAEFWACFDKGERVDYCNPKVQDRTCASSIGCEYCMSSYNETKDCYNQGNWMVCMNIERICEGIGGDPGLDEEAPNLTISSPEQDEMYTSKSVLLELKLDEEGSVYYYDNLNGRGRWVRVCSDCTSYSKSRRFNEGLNDLTFRAVDVLGNEAFLNRSFFIDSKKPKIHKTLPREGYASGFFEVQYTEENLEKVEITYGNYFKGFKTKLADGSSTAILDCVSGTKQWCGIELELGEYEGQVISYYFLVTDRAGNYKESQPKQLEVDTTEPVINELNYTIDGRLVSFLFNITEENFNSITYYDYSEARPRWRSLCSSLRDGICRGRKSFANGYHLIDIQVTDEAGNAVGKSVEFSV